MCMIKCDLDMLITCAYTKGEKDVGKVCVLSAQQQQPRPLPVFSIHNANSSASQHVGVNRSFVSIGDIRSGQ